jgi:protein-L-isoaspartate O-methyltransferase
MGAGLEPYAEPADGARRAMVRLITAGGGLRDPAWRLAFEEVPRHLFVPYYFVNQGGVYERLWREDPDPVRRERWLTGAYHDGPLATRVRDGELISSSSQPSLMALMLEALEVRYGDRVLEIGAGTGYNAALLCHRLGDSAVTTVDMETEITDAARVHLAAAGYRPAVVTGDGARGCPGRAPFDRIIATCTLPRIPDDWLAQCRDGARILAPLSTGLIALDVRGGGAERVAEGRFLTTSAFFVPLRGGGAGPERRAVAGVPHRMLENDLFRFLLTLTAGSLDPREALALWERERRPSR